MENLKIIEEKEILGKQFRMYGTIKEPLFKADEVSNWIEHSNTSVMLNNIDEDEKQLIKVGTLNNSYSAWFLTENGLYEVLMQSRKPIAKEFKKQVKQILKDIRLHGIYATDNTLNAIIENPEFGIKLLTELQNERAKRKQLEEENSQLAPQAQAYIDLMTADGYQKFIDIAQTIEIGRSTLLDFLRSKKVLCKQSNYNVPYGRFTKNGYFKVAQCKDDKGHFSAVTMVSSKGMDYIYKLIRKNNMLSEFKVAV